MIRTLHFSDFLKLGRLHEAEVGLNLPDSLVIPNSPLSAALIQRLPVPSLSSSVYIYEGRGKPEAFVQARARKRSEEWDVLALGIVDDSGHSKDEESTADGEADPTDPAETVQLVETQTGNLLEVNSDSLRSFESTETEVIPDIEEPEELNDAELETPDKIARPALPDDTEIAWQRLLEYLVRDAGERGVMRVYAKLSTESPEMSLFNQTGFHSYTHENLFRLNYQNSTERPPHLKIRSQRGRDAWFINELYRSITPTFVQNSEQNLAKDWDIHKGYFPRPVKEQGWVVEAGEKVIAYVRMTSNRHKHMVRIMHLDTQRELLPDLVRFVLSNLKAGPECLVYCTVREYQAEQEAILEDEGFSYLGKQAVMVKHTVQFVRNPERVLAHARDRKLELAHSTRPNFILRLLAKLPFHFYNQNNF